MKLQDEIELFFSKAYCLFFSQIGKMPQFIVLIFDKNGLEEFKRKDIYEKIDTYFHGREPILQFIKTCKDVSTAIVDRLSGDALNIKNVGVEHSFDDFIDNTPTDKKLTFLIQCIVDDRLFAYTHEMAMYDPLILHGYSIKYIP